MNMGYLISQAERNKTTAEQREIDVRNGELAAALAGLWHSLAAPWRFLRRAGGAGGPVRCSSWESRGADVRVLR